MHLVVAGGDVDLKLIGVAPARGATTAHQWSFRCGTLHRRSSTARHSPSTASGVASAWRARNSRQKHCLVRSGPPCRSRPAKGQPRAADACSDAGPPCELQTRRRPTQLIPREAMPRVSHRESFSIRPKLTFSLQYWEKREGWLCSLGP